MSSICVCNSGSDDLSVIDLDTLEESSKISLRIQTGRIGPHGICRYNDDIVTSNTFSNTLSFINFKSRKVYKSSFIGMHCNDLRILGNKAYVICGDSNSIIKYDIKNEAIEEIIPCGYMPHSIDFNVKNNMFVTSDMGSSSITIFKEGSSSYIKRIKVGEYPTKAVFTKDGEKVIVCESNIGTDHNGTISIIPLNNIQKRCSIEVGKWPVDIFYDNNICIVSNFGDSTISIINLDEEKEMKRIYVGGMPRGVLKKNSIIYVGDSYNNSLICMDMISGKKKVIPIGNEPTGIIFV
ncbi:DNA-binding beta-propeller fold protein YncE [Clostridium acetobutylicum]|uniref:Surface antigen n=1 Tax=Clostridium acetobutylicum (strain ATCC 824 / DSM 792 / JCM 1419 / IAM 19013 / LMG 5710 / NBRC 13948 / NRRL B-527 / VKM B-1787 / 2291 / W) TaxID=272562 RepID=Q97GI1_CLOAB|nr:MULTISPECIES: YncE family protein [Clostridium]AAK80341.1 Predicted protein of beta-propeller fold [Clostridium acetobutylicum ATCC 824]ADZ21438.1 protein of beta-propeller fold protein [Clostridium acetobutylicum EA 2018]AEI32314.1 beta-propeller fold protein [Clostridium acetobutylicum DSM 1731]AWV79238.1 YncE family protein [Clostridium acetobutylicum]MBC2394795.1 YncE family protein [Clostridium acetobutylicum]